MVGAGTATKGLELRFLGDKLRAPWTQLELVSYRAGLLARKGSLGF